MEKRPTSWVGRLNIVMTVMLPELIYRFSATLVKTPAGLFAEIYMLILKFIQKHKAPKTVEEGWRTHSF